MKTRIPAHLHQRAKELVYGGQWTPPPARPAATVVLLRDDPGGLQVALLQRSANLGFAQGMYVFPGGALDEDDAAHGDPWQVAAIRETFEECGVLLAEPEPPADVAALRRHAFADVLAELRVRPAVTRLHFIAHWVTPEVESRRFDTRFYAALLPAGQDLHPVTSEHQAVGWFRPQDTGSLPMLPPTAAALADVGRFATAEQALAAPRHPVPIMPRPVAVGEGEIDWVLVDERTGEPL